MNLIIDYGNTIIKTAVFSRDDIIDKRFITGNGTEEIYELLSEFGQISRGIISSVSESSTELTNYLSQKLSQFIILDQSTQLPIKNLYSTKASLGSDRIAGAVGAHTIFPDSNVLIIDAGTAITFDFLNAKGEFYGGNISPGRNMRAKALNNFTSKLPLADTEGDFPLLASDTLTALKSGVMNGIIFEMNGYIDKLKTENDDLKIILSGGDAKYFDKKLNYSIFVDSNINLTGLNRILEYNAIKN
jgi:type III pantothenate kinase